MTVYVDVTVDKLSAEHFNATGEVFESVLMQADDYANKIVGLLDKHAKRSRAFIPLVTKEDIRDVARSL